MINKPPFWNSRGLALVLIPLFAVVLALPISGSMDAAQAEPEVYEIDGVHSGAIFKIRHFFTMVPGRFDTMSGTIEYDAENPVNSKVDLVIDASSVDTDNEKRDEHLRSEDFFWVEKHPQITFKSGKIEKSGKDGIFKVHGDLTMRGVTRPVVMDVEVVGFGPDAWGGYRGGFHATTTIDRKDFGIVWNNTLDTGGAVLGDEVKIEVPLQVVRKS